MNPTPRSRTAGRLAAALLACVLAGAAAYGQGKVVRPFNGKNLNGFLHSLPNKLNKVLDDLPVDVPTSAATSPFAAVDNVFSGLGKLGKLKVLR